MSASIDLMRLQFDTNVRLVGGAGHTPVPLTLKPLTWSSVFGGERAKVSGPGGGWVYGDGRRGLYRKFPSLF